MNSIQEEERKRGKMKRPDWSDPNETAAANLELWRFEAVILLFKINKSKPRPRGQRMLVAFLWPQRMSVAPILLMVLIVEWFCDEMRAPCL